MRIDTLDSRDIIRKFDALKDEYDSLMDAAQEAKIEYDEAAEALLAEIKDFSIPEKNDQLTVLHEPLQEAMDALDEWNKEYYAEYSSLKDVIEECEGYGDWEYGATLINEDSWIDYVQEMLHDCGELPDIPSYVVIDWDATAENIAQDYMQVDFEGSTYYMRSC